MLEGVGGLGVSGLMDWMVQKLGLGRPSTPDGGAIDMRVSDDEGKDPWVYVTHDGVVRELTSDELDYLRQDWDPTDSGRPYVKTTYQELNGWGSIKGFCLRSGIPDDLVIESSTWSRPAADGVPCRRESCNEPRTELSVMCMEHHLEMLRNSRSKD
jgi:hypothetical protein